MRPVSAPRTRRPGDRSPTSSKSAASGRGLTTRSRSTATASECASFRRRPKRRLDVLHTKTSAPPTTPSSDGSQLTTLTTTSMKLAGPTTAESTASAAHSERTGTSNVTSITGVRRRMRASTTPRRGSRASFRDELPAPSALPDGLRRTLTHLPQSQDRTRTRARRREGRTAARRRSRADQDRRKHERRPERQQPIPPNARHERRVVPCRTVRVPTPPARRDTDALRSGPTRPRRSRT